MNLTQRNAVIRQRAYAGESTASIAREFGISAERAKQIIAGRKRALELARPLTNSLEAEAGRRGITWQDLSRQVLQATVDHNLFKAILED